MRDLKKAYDIIKEFEGLYLKAYKDPVGIPTIGWGTIRYPNGKKVAMGDVITDEQAQEYLAHEVAGFASGIESSVKVSLNNNEFCALVSFCYNLGLGAFNGSTLLRLLNGNEPRAIVADQFDRWVKAGGKTLKGLVRRRAAEKKLFLTPVESSEVIEKAGAEVETPAWFEPFKLLIIKLLEAVFDKETQPAPDNPAEDNLHSQLLAKNPFLPPKALAMALTHKDDAAFSKNRKYISIIDYDKPDWQDRFYFINMETLKCEVKTISAHGAKSDVNKDQYAETFSNKSGSNASSLGLMRWAEAYNSSKKQTGAKHRFVYSRRIDGLDRKLNSNMRARACVLHDGFYVSEERAKAKNVGDSLGCIVLPLSVIKYVYDRCEGSLLFCYHRSLD